MSIHTIPPVLMCFTLPNHRRLRFMQKGRNEFVGITTKTSLTPSLVLSFTSLDQLEHS